MATKVVLMKLTPSELGGDVFKAEVWDPSLSIWGGPILPSAPPGKPPHPQFPIWGPPGISLPPGEGYPPVAGHPLPVPPDTQPPPVDPGDPTARWVYGEWNGQTGWVFLAGPFDKPRPIGGQPPAK